MSKYGSAMRREGASATRTQKALEPEDPELVTAEERVAQSGEKHPAGGSGCMNETVTTILTTTDEKTPHFACHHRMDHCGRDIPEYGHNPSAASVGCHDDLSSEFPS